MGNTQTDLPPDVLKSRREISSRDIRSFTHSSRNPNEGPPSLQGIGLYTHAVPTSQILEFRDGEYRRPLPRFIGPLPTNGPTRRIREVQEDVKAAYEKLQAVINDMKNNGWRWTRGRQRSDLALYRTRGYKLGKHKMANMMQT